MLCCICTQPASTIISSLLSGSGNYKPSSQYQKSIDGVIWQTTNSSVTPARFAPTIVLYSSTIYLYGGFTVDSSSGSVTVLNDIWTMNVNSRDGVFNRLNPQFLHPTPLLVKPIVIATSTGF